jgi:ribosomal protein S18 acetylase RimI-like enzyme
MTMHVLENPVWHALTGPHTTVAEHLGLAARYVPDVAVFGALPDEASPDAWDALRELVGPGSNAFLARVEIAVPDTWARRFTMPCRQMWLTGAIAPDPRPDDGANEVIAPLGPADVPEMLELVARTRPGPLLPRTIELGRYVGVRDERKDLVAMAGERLHPPGFTEISAVCTDDAHRGRGLASRLVRTLVDSIRDRDETPFLHLTVENEAAHRVYAALGFETRTSLDVIGLQAPK